MRTTISALLLSAMVVAIGPRTAEAASITFQNQTFSGGSGWGNVLAIMGLQQAPQTTSETGAVSWNGTANVRSGDYTSGPGTTTTRTVAELIGAGITATDVDFGLVFNINDTNGNKDVQLSALAVNFFSDAGALLFSAPYVCVACAYPLPLTLDEGSQGLGNSGFLFRVALTEAERTQFFSSSTNRVGMAATVLRTDNGPEQFYLADLNPTVPLDPSPVPEPTSMLLLGSGLAALAYQRMRRSRRA